MNEIHSTSFVGNNVTMGNNVKIGPFCLIEDDVIIGNDVTMKAFTEIRSKCKIGNNVSFGSRCTLASGTIVEDNAIIKYGFVATDTPKIENSERTPCYLKKNSMFGANVTLMPNVTVGENSEVGACSQVRHDIPDNEIWFGIPAKFYRSKKD
jgi:acetyltransferase-like isoleucine patch superfamily enzyme